jgi:hypothetical protein
VGYLIDPGGFGVDDAAVAPKGVGYFQDEVFLEDAFWFEFIDQGVDELVINHFLRFAHS